MYKQINKPKLSGSPYRPQSLCETEAETENRKASTESRGWGTEGTRQPFWEGSGKYYTQPLSLLDLAKYFPLAAPSPRGNYRMLEFLQPDQTSSRPARNLPD